MPGRNAAEPGSVDRAGPIRDRSMASAMAAPTPVKVTQPCAERIECPAEQPGDVDRFDQGCVEELQ